jgi:uncharacterized protein (DUF983 family)
MEQKLKSFLEKPVVRGLMGRCPKCGDGKMFRAFLKVADNCPACGEELHHHRADDFPAYLVIVIVGHVVVGATLAVEAAYGWPLWLHALVWLPVTTAMALALIQPIKGAVVAWQWEGGMEGFGTAKRVRESLAVT